MKTQPVFKKFLRIFITAVIYSALFFIIYRICIFLTGIENPLPGGFLSFILILYLHDRISRYVRNFIDRNFYRRIFEINQALADFNSELNSILDYQVLIEKFISFLEKSFPDYTWAFYLRWGEEYELMGSNRLEAALPKLITFPVENILVNMPKTDVNFFSLSKFREKYPEMRHVFHDVAESDAYYYFLPLKSYKGSTGFLIFDRKIKYYLHFWSLKEMLLRVFNKAADVFENDQLYSEVKRKSLQNQLLLEIGKKISATLNLNEVLESIIDSVNQLLDNDAAGIFLVDHPKNQLKRQVTRGYDKKLLDKLALKLDLGSYGWVIRNKKPSSINDIKKDPYYYSVRKSTRSQLTVPLLNGDDVLGIMALESDKINHFTPSDLELLQTFASQAVIAIENAQLYEESLQKKRLESELVVASKVQKALLPDRSPRFEGYKISMLNIPSQIVGGDFFDIFRSGKSSLGVSIGDVSGKGAPASILMAMLYAGFKNLLKEIFPVVEVVARLNNLMTETTTMGYFATFFFGMINRENQSFTFTNAGHNPPILLRQNFEVERLETGGVVLGFLPDQEYRQETIQLHSGDYLVLFTDGVTEVKDSQREEFGDDRLIQFLKDHYGESPREMEKNLLKEIRRFSAQTDLADDVTLAIIYVE